MRIGRFLSIDPASKSLEQYSYCLNSPLNNCDPLGLWTIDRNAINTWADAKAVTGDTFKSLADLIRLDYQERSKWLKNSNNSDIRVDQEAAVGSIYKIPNLIEVYTSSPAIFENGITSVAYFREKAVQIGENYQDKKYCIEYNLEKSDSKLFRSIWKKDGIYAIAFAGHGTEYGFQASPDTGTNPTDVTPPYKLAAIYALSCRSADPIPGKVILANGIIPTQVWQVYISLKGYFIGYEGDVSRLNMRSRVKEINPPSPE